MGDTVKDIDRLIVTVISTRGSIPISNRLALLAAAHNTTLLLPLASDLACYYKLAWTGLDWTTNRHEGRRSQVGRYLQVLFFSTEEREAVVQEVRGSTSDQHRISFGFGAPFRSERVKNEHEK